jgi:uncharacterized protein YjiS (DUF1127 family)
MEDTMSYLTDKGILSGFGHRPQLPAALERTGVAVGRLVAAWRARRERTKAIDQLLRLDDRLLADMGVHRWELRDQVESGFSLDRIDR